jgi:hypothetical protein
MKNTAAATFIASLALMSVSSAWAQGSTAPSQMTPSANPDPIVRMHQQIDAANHEYDQEVAAAKKVYDHRKAAAKKKRDAAIAAARHGESQ